MPNDRVRVARSAPDGYTMMYTTSTVHGINPNIFSHLNFDPARDFDPVVQISLTTFVMLVNNDFPAKNAHDLIAMAKRRVP